MNIDTIFTTAQLILKGSSNLNIITEGEQKIISDLILKFDQFKDILLLRKYNTLIFRLIQSFQVREYKAQQFIYEDGNHSDIKYFLVGGEAVYTRQNQKLCQTTSKQMLFQKLEEKSQVNASENKKRAFQLIQGMKQNRTKPVRELRLGEQFGSREDYNDHLVFKSRRLEMEYLNQQEQFEYYQTLSVQAQTDCIVLCITQADYDRVFQPFIEKLDHLITALCSTLMNVSIEDKDEYVTEYFAHYIDESIYQQKEIVIQQGQSTDYLFFIKSGQVQIQKSFTELYRYGADQYIQQKNFLSSKTYEYNVQVIEPETAITRIQRYFIYLLLKCKSLSNNQNSKQTITSLYHSNSNSRLSQQFSQASNNSTSQTQNSYQSMARHSNTILDCSSLLSLSQREPITPLTQSHTQLSATLNNLQKTLNISSQNTGTITSSSSLHNNPSSKRFSSDQAYGGLMNNLSNISNSNLSERTERASSVFFGPTSQRQQRSKLIPTKNKIFQNFQKSISISLRKSEELKQAKEQEALKLMIQQDQIKELIQMDENKDSKTEPDQIQVTVSPNIIQNTHSSLKPKVRNTLKKMQTVSFSNNINDNDITDSAQSISQFISSQKLDQKSLFSSQNSEDTQPSSSRTSTKKFSYLKPKVLNIQDIFPCQDSSSNSLTSSGNLNEINFQSPKVANKSSINLQSFPMTRSTPNLFLKKGSVELKEFDLSKLNLTSRVLTPNFTSKHYFASSNKNSKHRNLNNSTSSTLYALQNKNSQIVKSQPIKRNTFIQHIFDNSLSSNSINQSIYLN